MKTRTSDKTDYDHMSKIETNVYYTKRQKTESWTQTESLIHLDNIYRLST